MPARPRLRACMAAAICALPHAAFAEMPAFVKGLSAGTIAVISDGDFVAQTYATGKLTPPPAAPRDILTVLSIVDGRVSSSTIAVSNSVTAPPEVVALTPDGRTAFVVERLGERSATAETVSDLPPGRRLFAIDLSDKAKPRIAAVAEIANPESVAVSPDGRRVAVIANTPTASLIEILSYAQGALGVAGRFDLAELGITGSGSGPRGGVTVTAVSWHPSGRFLAVNISTQDRVAFLETIEADGRLELRPWGNTVAVGKDPFVGRFTPDGRHYLTADWGRDLTAKTLEGRLPREGSSISVVRLAAIGAAGSAIRHERIGSVATGPSPEGIAVSPDGRLVATVNMGGTVLPAESPRFSRLATITLLTFEPQSGTLVRVGDYPFEGVLPEGGTFDLSGAHFLATVFQGHEGADSKNGSGVEVFRVIQGEPPALERLGRIPMPHGAHHVVVSR